jgi:hypothetical protein
MSSVTPVIQDAASEARYSTAFPMSAGWPMRPSGNDAPSSSSCWPVIAACIRSLSTADGARQLTRMPCSAISLARCLLNITTPAFAAA